MRDVHQGQGIASPLRDRLYARIGLCCSSSSLATGEESLYAHSVINTMGDKQDAKSRWLRSLVARVGKNKAAVALANKTVRTAWAVLHSGQSYCREFNDGSALMVS